MFGFTRDSFHQNAGEIRATLGSVCETLAVSCEKLRRKPTAAQFTLAGRSQKTTGFSQEWESANPFGGGNFFKMTSQNENIEQRVAAHPFLKGMEAQQLAVLSQSAMPTEFKAGQLVFKTGDPANGFYLIESGAVSVEISERDDKPVVVDVVRAGEPLGWSWIFEPYHWQFDARATEATKAICFPGILLRQHREEDLTLSHELFKRMCEVMVRRLQHAREKLAAEKKSGSEK